MLVVIAVIALLVSIIIPGISTATAQANAATDASNLRSILGLLNIHVVNGQKTVQEVIDASLSPVSKTDPDAILYAVFDAPGFIDVYYVNSTTGTYYGLNYLSDVATNGTSSISTAKPDIPGGTWYVVNP